MISNTKLLRKEAFILSFCFLISICNAQELTVSNTGSKILKDGNPITLRGVNMGNWLLWEGYMLNLDQDGIKTHSQIRSGLKDLLGNNETSIQNFENNWRNNYITNQDFVKAKQNGFNVVRIPFHYNMFWNDSTNSVKNDGFTWLDKAIDWASNNSMYVIFSMHAAPGYQNPDHHSDNPGFSVNFWDSNNSNINIAKSVWKHIAKHYSNYPGNKWLAGYDLLNEPVLDSNKSRLKYAYKEMTTAIRSEDPNHLIFAEGNYYSSDFYDMLERWDSNLVFSNHYYGDQGEQNPNANLNTIINQANNLNIPLLVGEFGENTLAWVENARVDYDSQNLSWIFWAWKRHETDRSIYSFDGFYGWWRITQYLKYGDNKPTSQETQNWLNELINKVNINNSHLQTSLRDKLLPAKPINKYIWLKNSNRYVSSNNGFTPVTCNRFFQTSWEKFQIIDAGNGKVALKGNNNKYINSQNGNSEMICNSNNIQGWEAFEWIDIYGKVALKGFNGKFVSSEGGSSSGMNSNRNTVSGWESFEWGILSSLSNSSLSLKTIQSDTETNLFKIYPNPSSDIINFSFNKKYNNYKIEIFNTLGQKIIAESTKINSINISNLKSGNYLLKITLNESFTVNKVFVKQ